MKNQNKVSAADLLDPEFNRRILEESEIKAGARRVGEVMKFSDKPTAKTKPTMADEVIEE